MLEEDPEYLWRALDEERKNVLPNVDFMTYEQLLELEEKIGKVEIGFNEIEISLIPKRLFKMGNDDSEQK